MNQNQATTHPEPRPPAGWVDDGDGVEEAEILHAFEYCDGGMERKHLNRTKICHY